MGQILIKTPLSIDRVYFIDDTADALKIVNMINHEAAVYEVAEKNAVIEALMDAKDCADVDAALLEAQQSGFHRWEDVKAELGL